MAKLSPSKLQAALDALAAANNRAYHAREKIMEHCLELYGAEPGQVDNDEFIDACDGGNGTCIFLSKSFSDVLRRRPRTATAKSRYNGKAPAARCAPHRPAVGIEGNGDKPVPLR